MTKGRPTIPTEIKRKTGTLRSTRIEKPTLEVNNSPGQIQTPSHLGQTGQQFWNTLWQTNWVSTTSDFHLALITAETLDEREEVKAALAEDPRDRKLRMTLRELDKQLMGGLSLLGFSPSDRSRLGVAEIRRESKLEALMRQKAEKYGNLHSQTVSEDSPKVKTFARSDEGA